MAGYVERALAPNEAILVTAKPHWALFVAPALWFLLGIVLVLPLLIAIPLLIYRLFVYLGTELALTDKRVIAKTGFISRDIVDVSLSKVEGVTYKQGIFGRIFGYGSIFVRGTGSGFVPIRFIAYPELFKAEVDRKLHS